MRVLCARLCCIKCIQCGICLASPCEPEAIIPLGWFLIQVDHAQYGSKLFNVLEEFADYLTLSSNFVGIATSTLHFKSIEEIYSLSKSIARISFLSIFKSLVHSLSPFIGTMLANFHMCGIMLVLRAVFNMLVRNAESKRAYVFMCLMFSLSGPCELLFLLCFIASWT